MEEPTFDVSWISGWTALNVEAIRLRILSWIVAHADFRVTGTNGMVSYPPEA